jgi:23S rRNA (adenine-N6)-dimethyltransferase
MSHRSTPQHHQDVISRRAELSQHFLRSARTARRLVRTTGLGPGDLVVDIGAGRGAITQALVDAGCRVVAIEKDVRLFRALRARFIGRTNVECHNADILTWALPRGPYHVVSNLPYGITAAVVRRLLHAPIPPASTHLIVQREAAEKFAGVPRETLFSLLHKPVFSFAIASTLSRTDFVPPPSVDSVVLRIVRRDPPLIEPESAAAYRRFVRGAFAVRGPHVRQALRALFTPHQVRRLGRDLGFAPDARVSELTFAQWVEAFRFWERACRPRGELNDGRSRQLAAACDTTNLVFATAGMQARRDRVRSRRG